MPFRLGAPELILILTVIMIIFGVGKLPQVGGAIGKTIREFRRARSGEAAEEIKPKRARRQATSSSHVSRA